MTVELIKIPDPYTDAFCRLLAKSSQTEPSWLTQSREAAFEYFKRSGFPTVREEDWKYTNVSPIARARFTPTSDATVVADSLNGNAKAFFYDETRDSRLVFLNGVFHQNLSAMNNLPNGVVIGDFAEVMR